MRLAHPRTLAGRALLWTLLVALSSVTLLARRPFESWRQDLLVQEDLGRRRLAAIALRDVPDEQIPRIVGALALALRDPDPRLAGAAKETVHLLAPRAGEVLARAVVVSEGEAREQALLILSQGGAGVVPAVVEILLLSTDPAVRGLGLAVLEDLGPAGAGAAPELERLAVSSSGAERKAYLRTLWIVDRQGLEFFNAAQHATQDPDPEVRAQAWMGLAHTPLLALRARDPRYARALEQTLERELPAIPPALREALDEGLAAQR